MNIEESVEYLKNCLDDKYNFKNATRKKDKQALETLLTAYEKEKEKNKELNWKYTASWVDEHFISKDKIKLKMKQEMDKGYRLSEERHLQNYAYDRLKELLEGNNE